jgi:sirohydrochlorin cobaltochelatase
MPLPTPNTGILLLARGSTETGWTQPFEAVVTSLIQDGASPSQIALAYLDVLQPDIITAANGLAMGGCTVVAVVPLMLGAGSETLQTLTGRVALLRSRFPQIKWTLSATVSTSPALIQTLARIARQDATQAASATA